MEDLILTMLVAHNNYGDALNFTKSEVDNLIKKHLTDIDKIDCNEYGYIILLENGYITKDQFAKKMGVIYENKHYWLITHNFEDLLPSKYETEAKILDGNYDFESYDFYDYNIDNYFWGDFNEETLKSIIEYCNKNNLEVDIENDEGNYETIELKNNLILKNGDIYINDKFDNLTEYKLRNLIDEEDGLADLKNEICFAISDAQEDADQLKIYNKIKKSVIDKIGPYENIVTGNKDGIKIMLDFDMDDVKNFLSNDEYEFNDTTYGSLETILQEMEFFDIDKPYYDISGTIDDDYLNELIQDRLLF
jgi:hypothetical protein